MKTLKKLGLITLLLGFILSSCQIDKSVNVDPNNIAEENVKTVNGINALIVALQVNAGDTYSRDRSRLFSVWSWQMCAPPGIARPQPVAYNNYIITSDGPPDDYWVITYRGVKIANDIIKFTPSVFVDANAPLGNAISGMAKVIKLFFLENRRNLRKHPDTIEVLILLILLTRMPLISMFRTVLDDAISDFAKGTATFTRELKFKGDAAKWTAVAYSLKHAFICMLLIMQML